MIHNRYCVIFDMNISIVCISHNTKAVSRLVPVTLKQLSYTSFEQPSVITESPYQATFKYNTEGQRASMVVTQNGSTILSRWYTGSRYIRETAGSTTKEFTWIGGDAYTAPCVAIKTNTGSQIYYYLLRDHLGTITHVTNASGTVQNQYSFDAWGRRRNFSNWSYTVATQTDLLPTSGCPGLTYTI